MTWGCYILEMVFQLLNCHLKGCLFRKLWTQVLCCLQRCCIWLYKGQTFLEGCNSEWMFNCRPPRQQLMSGLIYNFLLPNLTSLLLGCRKMCCLSSFYWLMLLVSDLYVFIHFLECLLYVSWKVPRVGKQSLYYRISTRWSSAISRLSIFFLSAQTYTES